MRPNLGTSIGSDKGARPPQAGDIPGTNPKQVFAHWLGNPPDGALSDSRNFFWAGAGLCVSLSAPHEEIREGYGGVGRSMCLQVAVKI